MEAVDFVSFDFFAPPGVGVVADDDVNDVESAVFAGDDVVLSTGVFAVTASN